MCIIVLLGTWCAMLPGGAYGNTTWHLICVEECQVSWERHIINGSWGLCAELVGPHWVLSNLHGNGSLRPIVTEHLRTI